MPDLTTLISIANAVQKALVGFRQELEAGQRKAKRREKLATRLARVVAALSDEELSIAVEQVEALARRARS